MCHVAVGYMLYVCLGPQIQYLGAPGYIARKNQLPSSESEAMRYWASMASLRLVANVCVKRAYCADNGLRWRGRWIL